MAVAEQQVVGKGAVEVIRAFSWQAVHCLSRVAAAEALKVGVTG